MERFQQIIDAPTPAQAKFLGRRIKGFDKVKWLAACEDVMIEGLREKFAQHEKLRRLLIESYPKHLIESSPYDLYWGNGLHKFHPDSRDPSKYPGKNRLGRCLEEVRHSIMVGSMELD